MKTTLTALALAALSLLGAGDSIARQESSTDTEQKAVLITGASTGIGRNMAETLAAKGFFVYAGARKQADIDALSAIENIQGIRLDVTVQKAAHPDQSALDPADLKSTPRDRSLR
jgi:NAD(P)-dependent dehydrogenase (short-subunit alcohol dehydrogenase family)